MSIRTVQTKLRASPSFNVLTAIDTNSPPGLAYKAQDIELYLEKPSQPSYHHHHSSALSPHPGSFNRRSATSGTSTLSPFASPYKPRSAPRTTSQIQFQNQTQRAGARAGRGLPALGSGQTQEQGHGLGLDSELLGANYPQWSSGSPSTLGGGGLSNSGSFSMDPIFNGVPSYSVTPRFDPFGDYPGPEKTSTLSIPRTSTSTSSPHLTSSPANSPFGAGTGNGPAYTHYYYYDKATNSPMLAYSSGSSSRQSINNNNNRNRIHLNHPRNSWNHKVRGNNNNYNYNNRRLNLPTSNTFSSSPSRSPSPPSPQQVTLSFTSVPNSTSSTPTPSRSPSPPSPTFLPHIPAPTSASPLVKADMSLDPAPIRTRKRSNAFREAPKYAHDHAQPTAPLPLSSPTLPAIKPKEIEKKADSSMVSKLVAAMLLNRVDATGRSRSRCGGSAMKRDGIGGVYVKSGLSRVVFVESVV
ncbi:hypothetical protein E1B28_002310 [Marasmius oreades]|uniref:Uncharacterized protein n=1 Tax=Marasmius oreades TaxID=181124 RepID=A0A9P7RMK9_9AGAR|nr:uncharacterized protein E1B28_002310 [Marasmius oreades]KAG7086349.1 hypothetical protein E1B28_002310 [Marasmius oreades]